MRQDRRIQSIHEVFYKHGPAFGTTEPFSEEARLEIARMSRGIFRRFLRYITLTLDLWEANPAPLKTIETILVKQAITAEQLAEDMEFELSELFPKNLESGSTAIKILNLLEEGSDWNQKSLAKQLEIPEYKLSRLLRRLDRTLCYRREDGTRQDHKTIRNSPTPANMR